MTIKKLISFIFIFIYTSFTAQDTLPVTRAKRNTIYLEVFGQGIYNSISFDRLFLNKNKTNTSFSAGATLLPTPDLFVAAVPISYNVLFGKKRHHLELGFGFTAMYLKQSNIKASESYIDYGPSGKGGTGIEITVDYTGQRISYYTYFTHKIGYRYQKPEGGPFMRVTFSPVLAGYNKIGNLEGGNPSRATFPNYELFSKAAFFDSSVFPWGGISLGWTFKK